MCQIMLHFHEPLCNISDNVKINFLLIWAGNESQELSETFVFQREEEKNMEGNVAKRLMIQHMLF